MDISFNFLSPISLENRTILKQFVSRIFKKEKRKLSTLSFIFCSDSYLLHINKTYLQHDYFTDIITFDLSEPGSGSIDGEIYISTDTVRSNATRFGTTVKNELHRVIFHGVLHLCGYHDKTDQEQKLMTQKEDHYLKLYRDVPRGAS
jgi:rRNA maturation RNase YbeY